MLWPPLEDILKLRPPPEGYTWDLMTGADVLPLIDSMRAWFPAISVGVGSCYLRTSFYSQEVVFHGDLDKDVMVLLARHDGEIVGMSSWERDNDALALYARLGVASPAHRNGGLAIAAMEIGERMGRAMGAGLIYTLATLRLPHMQAALERTGYELIGFMPGYDREEISPGLVKRVYEAGYAKRLLPPDEYLQPDTRHMTPTVRRLFDSMFPTPIE